jgi:hypothetical protein
MTTIGSYEAKTHLPELLERVARGERIMITKRGKPAHLHRFPLHGSSATQQPSVRQGVAFLATVFALQGS